MLNLGNINFDNAATPNTVLKVVAPSGAGINAIGPSGLADDGNTLTYKGNPIVPGAGGVSGSGTTNKIPKFSAGTVLADSSLDDGVTTANVVTSSKPVSAPYVLTTTVYSAAGTPLPAAAAGLKGARAIVSDATAPTFLGVYTSGSAVFSPVICDGTAWRTA